MCGKKCPNKYCCSLWLFIVMWLEWYTVFSGIFMRSANQQTLQSSWIIKTKIVFQSWICWIVVWVINGHLCFSSLLRHFMLRPPHSSKYQPSLTQAPISHYLTILFSFTLSISCKIKLGETSIAYQGYFLHYKSEMSRINYTDQLLDKAQHTNGSFI